jgi:hypothetical protein
MSTSYLLRNTGDYAQEEVAQMAYSLAVKAITNP